MIALQPTVRVASFASSESEESVRNLSMVVTSELSGEHVATISQHVTQRKGFVALL